LSADVVLERCGELAAISDEPGRLTRVFAGPAMGRAHERVRAWMSAAGMAVRLDAAGNLIGRREAAIRSHPPAPTLVLGSHLDTVRDAGAFDGPLGILVAIAALERVPQLPYAVEVVAFSDEEGVRFGTAYLGSRSFAGTFPHDLLELTDADGTTMAQALAAFGGDPDGLAGAARTGEPLLGYVEVHIEQGPVLEQRGVPLGVVGAIAGATRAEVRFRGQAGHAGTVPMDMRHDALAGAAEWALGVEATGRETKHLVATVGRLQITPGAPNVIAGDVLATLDVRHREDQVRERTVAALRAQAQAIAAARGLSMDWTTRLEAPAVWLDPQLSAALAHAIDAVGHRHTLLTSGAGHDAVALADLTRAAMLFVRCAGGLSHHPDESVERDDVAAAVDVLERFLADLRP
jgi:allantoate deiminase